MKVSNGSIGVADKGCCYRRRLPDGHIVGIFLLLPLFGKQIEYLLSIRFLGHAIEKTAVTLNVLTPDEFIHDRPPFMRPPLTGYRSGRGGLSNIEHFQAAAPRLLKLRTRPRSPQLPGVLQAFRRTAP